MRPIILICFIFMCLTAWAENKSGYVHESYRDIKALSEKQIDNYLQGAGMGFAMAAELNHYPGPKHVLDLAATMTMTAAQINQTRQLFERMNTEAKLLGRKLIEEEKTLDRLFKHNKINEIILRKQLDTIAKVKSQLRYLHLNTHLQQKVLLTQNQIEQYDALRGYTSGKPHEHSHSKLN